MAKKTIGKTYQVKVKTVMGQRFKYTLHAPDEKTAEKAVKELHPHSGTSFKTKRYKGEPAIMHIRKDGPDGPKESIESMHEPAGTNGKDFADRTFAQRGYEQKDPVQDDEPFEEED